MPPPFSYFAVTSKYEKLGKYFPYCTRHRTITTTYRYNAKYLQFEKKKSEKNVLQDIAKYTSLLKTNIL